MKLETSEIETWQERGKTAVRGQEREIPHMSDEDLRKFVLDYCGGHVLTNLDVPPHMVSMVFLPLALGALSLPEEIQELLNQILPDPGSRPDPSTPPKPPTLEVPPPKPEPSEELAVDLAKLEELDMAIRWHHNQAEFTAQRDAYLDQIQQDNEVQLTQYQEAVAAWELLHQAALDRNAALQADYEAELARIQLLNDDITAATEAWELADARHAALEGGARVQYFSQIGVFTGNYADAFPTGINGLPMFHTMRCLHVDDWKRAAAAIQREMERAKTLDV